MRLPPTCEASYPVVDCARAFVGTNNDVKARKCSNVRAEAEPIFTQSSTTAANVFIDVIPAPHGHNPSSADDAAQQQNARTTGDAFTGTTPGLGRLNQQLSGKKSSDRLLGIGFARFVGSCHVVVGHLYQSSRIQPALGFFRYGFTWVPWFFMLSGFILTHVELGRATPKPIVLTDFLKRRLEGIYPMYALGMLLSVVTFALEHGLTSSPSSLDLLLHACMLQSWVPPTVERGLGLLVQCWFLSNLFAYWLCFPRILSWVREASDQAVRGPPRPPLLLLRKYLFTWTC
jgi:hypothetical protein